MLYKFCKKYANQYEQSAKEVKELKEEVNRVLKLIPKRFHKQFIEILESNDEMTPKIVSKNFAIFFEDIVSELTDDERNVIREKNIFL